MNSRRRIGTSEGPVQPMRATLAPCGRQAVVNRLGVRFGGSKTEALTYSITRSAIARRFGGISIPNAFAVLRLINNWNFVGCSIGKSAGLAPLKILPTRTAAVRNTSL